jgi:hypothetical protein
VTEYIGVPSCSIVRAVVLLLIPALADAEPIATLAGGGEVGFGTSGRTSFPACYAGATAVVEYPLVPDVALGAGGRALAYNHPEDEDFGSHGVQLDGTVGVTAHVGPVFAAVRAGGGALYKTRSCDVCRGNATMFSGSVATLVVGGDFDRVRVQLAITRPAFAFHDDIEGPPWQFTFGLLALSRPSAPPSPPRP